MKLSLCMIVKNEESCLERCLDSVKGFADEIVIVDTGSSDKTKEIAKKFTDKIFDFEWCNDFSKARNFSLSKATGDWIFVLDADEVIDEPNKKRILGAINSDADALLIRQREYRRDKKTLGFTLIDKKDEFTQDYEGYTSTPVIRLFRNNKKIFFEDSVHETVGKSAAVSGLRIIDRKDIFIHHYKEEKGEEKFRERQLAYFKIEQETLKKDPKNARAHYKIAGIYDAIFSDYEQCITHLNLAYENGYNERYCLISIGNCLLKLKKYEEAEKIFIKALSKGYAEPSIYYNLFKIYSSRKDYRRAKMVLQELIKIDSEFKKEAELALKSIKTN
jgi:glycosyltransferase involved in cell wall biosynthesis